MIVKLDNSQHCEVPLSLLMKYSPYVSPIWADCEAGSITLGGVGKKLESKLFARKRFSEDVIFESELYWKKNLYPVYETKAGWHEARIAYLV
ncbi:MAG: hypothetical protein KDH96_06925, partial [Candidatus Riesia sp.]|nr:hypothetical protein [Candidatus Riesia sp.]